MKHLFVRQIYFLKGNDVLKAFSKVLSLAFLCAAVFLQTSFLQSTVSNAYDPDYQGFNKWEIDKDEDIYKGQSYSDCSNNQSSSCDFRRRARDDARPYRGGRDHRAAYDNQHQTVTELYNAHDGYENSNLKEMNGERMSTITMLGVAINVGYIAKQCRGLTGGWNLFGPTQALSCAAAGVAGAAQVLQYVRSKNRSEEIEASIDYDLAPANGLNQVGLTDIPESQRISPAGVSSGLLPNGLSPQTPQTTPDTEPFRLPSGHIDHFKNGNIPEYVDKYIKDGEIKALKYLKKFEAMGYKYDPKTNKVTLPNGVSLKATEIFTPEGAKKMGLSPQEAKAFLASHRRASKAAEKAKDKMEAQLNKDIKALKKQRRKLAEQRRLAGTGHQRRGFVPYKDNWKAPDFSHLLNGLNVDQEQQKGTLSSEDAYFVLGRAEDNIFEMVHRRYQAKRELLTSGLNIDEENLAKDPVFLQRRPRTATRHKALPIRRPASQPVKSSSFLQESL